MDYPLVAAIVRDLGFPIVVALFVLFRLNGSLDKLKKSIDSERVTKADSSWNVANLINSWTDYSADYQGASFFKDSNGIVHIRGLIKDGSSTTAVMFVLPSGYRPGNREIFNTYSNNGATRLDVKIDGSVLAQSNASTTWTSLSGISFSALKIR